MHFWRRFVLLAACGSLLLAPGARSQDKPDAPPTTPTTAPETKPDATPPAAETPAPTSDAKPQAPDTRPDTPAPQAQTPAKAADGSTSVENAKVPKRIFFIVPNFMTANDQPENKGPLTPKQKFNIAWHQWYDMSAHFGNLIQASISQAANGIPHYGQGWGAFGERMAAQEGDQFTGSMLIYGVLPTLLHQDPRYFRKGKGKPLSRVLYAASRVVIARTDAGKPTFNYSQIFGQLGQASISLSYYPQQDRTVAGLFTGFAINQAYNVGWNQLKEWTPDLNAVMSRRRARKQQKKSTELHDSRSPLESGN